MATFENSLGTWWLPDEGSAAYLEGYKALYAEDEEVYEENSYEKGSEDWLDWYAGWLDALAARWPW